MLYFNELNVDLNNEEYFPSYIYERTKDNPNPKLTAMCRPCDESLDAYISELFDDIFSALKTE